LGACTHPGDGGASLSTWARVGQSLAGAPAQSLREHGYAVIDGFWGEQWSEGYRREMRHLLDHNLMLPNKTQFLDARGQPIQCTKPNIFELDLHNEEVRRLLPVFGELFGSSALVEGLNDAVDGLALVPGTDATTVKLQYNAGGGGCFPLHYDNPGPPNKRRVTMLTYLNPGWEEGDGGELQLVPWMSKPVTVAPKMDRVVIFLSDVVLHRVLPASKGRLCFTVWIDGAGTNAPEDNAIDMRKFPDLDTLAVHLALSPAQRLLARGVYREAFARSLRDCMGDAPGSAEMLESHDKYILAMRANRGLSALVERLRAYHDVLQTMNGFTV